MKILPLLCLLLISFAAQSFAQGSFSATLEPAVIGKDETAEFKLLVENAGEAELLAIPSLKDFTIVSGPNQESGMESINGNVRRYVGYSYILKPKSTGNFTIGQATAKVDGKTLRSKQLQLKVTTATTNNSPSGNNPFAGISPFDEPAPPSTYNDFILRKGERVEDKINKNIFIRVETDKTSCYVGEPIVVAYKLYTRLKSESNIIKSPAFNGFSVVDLVPPTGGNYSIEKFNGRMYNVYLLRKAQLYPLQAGADTLEAASVDNKINFVKAEYLNSRNTDDFLNGFLQPSLPAEAMQTEKVTLLSKPVAIIVKPLPSADSLEAFHGAVGDFSLQAVADKANFTTSEAGRLQVTITGAGNFTLLNPPEIKWPAGIETFEPLVKENLNRLSVPVGGSKVYTYSFTIESPGHYTLPPVVFSFFDLAEKRYKTIQTEPINLTITKGSGAKTLGIKADERGLLEKFSDTIFTNRWMIIVPVALLILIGLFFWLRADSKEEEKNAADTRKNDDIEKTVSNQTPEQPASVHPFEQSEKLLNHYDTALFYQTLNKELQYLLTTKLKLPGGAGKQAIAAAVNKAEMSFGDATEIKQLMDDIEMQLYTPFADENLQGYFERALGVEEKIKAI